MNAVTLQQRRYQRICEIGCLACRRVGWYSRCQVHHLNLDEHAGQVRLGNLSTIGLCPWHHVGEPIDHFTRDECRELLGPSLKHEPVAFREAFGSDEALLAWENELIEGAEYAVVGRRA